MDEQSCKSERHQNAAEALSGIVFPIDIRGALENAIDGEPAY
jgi:hypothetical protein